MAVSVAAAALLLAGLSTAKAEVDHAAIAKAALDGVIRPGYAELAKSADALSGRIAALCATPSAPALAAAKEAFATTVAAWSKIEIYRFGPIIQDQRYERIFYWPDPKGLGLRQVQTVLKAKDATVTDPDQLAAKSVALQGLPALEYLLYGDGADTLTQGGGDGAFRCGFAASVATNVDRVSRNVGEGWREGAAYAKAFLGPVPAGPLYHSAKEVTLELFKSFTTGIELVRDQKLAKPLGENPEHSRPRLAAFWRSGLSFQNMACNLAGVRDLFAKGGFAAVVAEESPGVEGSVEFDLDHAIDVLRAMNMTMQQAVQDEDTRAKLEALRVSLKGASQTAGDMISRVAALSFGFNAMDGD